MSYDLVYLAIDLPCRNEGSGYGIPNMVPVNFILNIKLEHDYISSSELRSIT